MRKIYVSSVLIVCFFAASALSFNDVGVIVELPDDFQSYCVSVDNGETVQNVFSYLGFEVEYDSTMQEITRLEGTSQNSSHVWGAWISTGDYAFSKFSEEIIADYEITHGETVLGFGYFQEGEGRIPNRYDHRTLCPRPSKGPFRGQTTEFDDIWYQNLTHIENLTIEHDDFGMIQFNRDKVDITGYLFLEDHFQMSKFIIDMPKDGGFSNLKPTITFYDVDFSNYTIYLDHDTCSSSVCTNVVLEDEELKFDAETTGEFEVRERVYSALMPEIFDEKDYRISIVVSQLSQEEVTCEDTLTASVILRRFQETFISNAKISISVPKMNKQIEDVVRMQEIFKRNYTFLMDHTAPAEEYTVLIDVMDPNGKVVSSEELTFRKNECMDPDKNPIYDLSSIGDVVVEGDEPVLEVAGNDTNQTLNDSLVEVSSAADEEVDEPDNQLESQTETPEERRARLEKEDAERLERALALAEQREALDELTGAAVVEPPETLGLITKLIKLVIIPLVVVGMLAFLFIKGKNKYDQYMQEMEKDVETQLQNKKVVKKP